MDHAAVSLPDDFLDDYLAGSSSKVPVVTCTIDGPLQAEQVAEYLSKAGKLETTQKSSDKDLATLRAKHHSVARLLATGMPEGLVADLCGFDAAYLSTLKSNPSMVELINHYRAPGNAAAEIITEKLRTVGDAALGRIMDELPNMDHQALIGVAKLGTDRSGNGPQSKVNHEHSHTLDLGKIRDLAESARKVNQERIVPISDVRKMLPAPKVEPNAD